MHMTLHWTDDNVVAIDLDSLVDHQDHGQVHGRVFVHNCAIYGTGIGMFGLFDKAVDVNKTFVVTND